jgi:hypothetical protein
MKLKTLTNLMHFQNASTLLRKDDVRMSEYDHSGVVHMY